MKTTQDIKKRIEKNLMDSLDNLVIGKIHNSDILYKSDVMSLIRGNIKIFKTK